MDLSLEVHIDENTENWRIIENIAKSQNLSHEQVIEKLLNNYINALDDNGYRASLLKAIDQLPSLTNETYAHDTASYNNTNKTPAEMLIGLFSEDSDAKLIDEVTAMVYERRSTYSTRDIGM